MRRFGEVAFPFLLAASSLLLFFTVLYAFLYNFIYLFVWFLWYFIGALWLVSFFFMLMTAKEEKRRAQKYHRKTPN